MGSQAATGAGPEAVRAPKKKVPLGRFLTLAVVGNLLLATGGAAVFAPIETSRTALETYDALPEWIRTLLGDRRLQTDSETRHVGTEGARGPVGGWLEDLYLAALEGDRTAQLEMPLDLETDVTPGQWSSVDTLQVSWLSFDSGFRYRLQVTPTETAPDLTRDYAVETAEAEAALPVPEGAFWVHVQAADERRVGPVGTAGPFLVDRSPPEAPTFIGGTSQTVPDYHFSLQWRPVTDDAPLVSYHLEKSRDKKQWDEVAVLAPDETEHRERNQPNGQYHYRVRAENAAGLTSAYSPILTLLVDARANLQPPAYGSWHYGINATYDSVIHMWDLSDPSDYVTLNRLTEDAEPSFGGLSAADHALYTAPGWGIELADRDLCDIAAAELGGQCVWDAGGSGTNDDRWRIQGGEQNTLKIGLKLFAWLFDATDYDFDKFNDPAGQDFLKASETLARGGGICGDLTALYITMMRMAGVPARPVHGYLENNQDGIGGFHMWAEIYVGGDDPLGPWLPVDVSGVSGAYDPSYLLIYFGVANPLYLQLGIQKDLGEPDLPRDDARARWNVWANMQYTYFKQQSGGGAPQISWDADARIHPVSLSTGRIWFDPDTKERVFCEGTERCVSERLVHYFDDVRGRSVRNIDYGADVSFDDGSIEEISVRLKFPEQTASNQVAIFTLYRHDAACTATSATPNEMGDGFLEWTAKGQQAPCSQ